ncbi:CRISPR-associated protein Cas4 [Marinilabilia sp.]|uniref:CRISPR-associated protein Cas4 n=1 Tax=Marinilabilia sp. TaxID=2021252 RepID=UPI0025C4C71D|nr:CRISPR-associated protein Cas4 [Marinilabilia sp.]
MRVTGTLISYFFYCHRRLWLHANDIKLEDNSEDVSMGVLIEETTYSQRSDKYKQIELGPVKIDFFDWQNKIIHEVKKSSKFHETHIWQIKYYIYIMENAGIGGVTGMLEYPTERKKENVFLSQPDRICIDELKNKITQIIQSEKCPPVLNSHRCKNCAYSDFCYAKE